MKYCLSIIAILLSFSGFGQRAPVCGDPSVITYSDPVFCTNPCATLHAVVNGENPVSAGITIDDMYSGIIPIGFNFTYFGTSYNRCVIGANGTICFNVGLAGTFAPWTISAPLLGNSSVYNSICGPWCDIDPALGGTITYATSGVTPFRRFTATWCHTAMFNTSYCPGQWTTTQIILYEGCNYIDVQIGNKTVCTSWNGGYAITGVQNATGSAAVVAPGRDYPATYTCTNEGWRFTPSGSTYTVASIPFSPVPNGASTINWYSGATGGTLLGTGSTLPCVPLAATYRAEMTGCDFTSTSIINVPAGGAVATGTVTVCVGRTEPISTLPLGGTWSGGSALVATLAPLPLPGTVTGVSVGTTTYTYSFTGGCSYQLLVNVVQCDCNDTCYWTLSGNNIHGGRNIFGTLSNDNINIISNNVNRAVIQANGNIGIKQLAPSTTLDMDCTPVMAPSGLQFEHLPFGHGNALLVDPAGYVYVSQNNAYRSDNTDMQDQINQLKQQIEDLKAQLGISPVATDNNSGNSLAATPNPTNGQITVSYTIAAAFGEATIRITDNQGRTIASKAVNNNNGAVKIELPTTTITGNLVIALIVDGKLVAQQKEILVK